MSALACTLGAAIPLLAGAFVEDDNTRIMSVVLATALGCLMFGIVASALGGAGIVKVWTESGARGGVGSSAAKLLVTDDWQSTSHL